MAERLTTNQEVAGSTPAKINILLLLEVILLPYLPVSPSILCSFLSVEGVTDSPEAVRK